MIENGGNFTADNFVARLPPSAAIGLAVGDFVLGRTAEKRESSRAPTASPAADSASQKLHRTESDSFAPAP